MPGYLAQSNGYIASITDVGSPVNIKFSGNTNTKQFKEWFKNTVEEIEKLKHIYKPPVEMQEKWDESHKHYVEKYAWIKTMLSM